MKNQLQFSHVPNFTDYMEMTVKTVTNFFDGTLNNNVVLNIPAGNVLVAEDLKHLETN